VTDELSWIGHFNEQVRRLRAIVDSARPNIRRLVAGVMTTDREPNSEDQIRGWREQANIKAARTGSITIAARQLGVVRRSSPNGSTGWLEESRA
jgi:hypothetical protein